MIPNVWCAVTAVLVMALAEQGLGQTNACDVTINNFIGLGNATNATGGSCCSANVMTSLTRILELLEPRQNDSAVDTCNQTALEPAPPATQTYPRDCQEYLDRGFNTSGVYTVTLTPNDTTTNTEAYCDMETDGGGWTVFQRRLSDVISFERAWDAYKRGFGPLEGDLWWGNEHVALSVNDGRTYDLRVDLFDWSGEHRYAKYANFCVAGEDDNYRLTIGQYTGDAGDSLTVHNNLQFSTPDRDNDRHKYDSCAVRYGVGFWFRNCFRANLNHPYQPSSAAASRTYVIIWYHWRESWDYSLHRTEMKFRVTDE